LARETQSDQLLEVYLNEHLAGSAAAVDLVGRVRAQNEGTALASFLAGLQGEIEADRETLQAVMGRLGVPASTLKQLAGKVAETLSRLRLDEHITGGAVVTRLMELETLSLGIEGKLSMWHSLQQVADARPGWPGSTSPHWPIGPSPSGPVSSPSASRRRRRPSLRPNGGCRR